MKKNAANALVCLSILLQFSAIAQSGKDGVKTVLNTNVVFNRYDVVVSTVAAGATTVEVADVTNLAGGAAGVSNPYIANALGYGDLIMIIKMQGSTIDVSNTAAYGNVTALNNVGAYELALVRGVIGNVIHTCIPFTKTFTVNANEKVQVVRMPRLSTLIIVPGANIIATPWSNGKGGVVALEIDGNVAVHGAVSADGAGYSGGIIDNNSLAAPSTIVDYVNVNDTHGAEKGESIAGSRIQYDAMGGRYGRGAPANGGGGGNTNNAGGGGGANGGIPANWNGNGNPDNTSTNWSNAWNTESAGFSGNLSDGGGRGGYSFAGINHNALAVGPDNTSWGGDNRRNVGGKGGRPLVYDATTLFMGGGGGAGDANNNAGGAGGNGGGIVYMLITGSLSGAGTISANGSNGQNTRNTHVDAAGGGGGGGAVRLNVQGAISQVSVFAHGGNGGSQLLNTAESEGPGGGGGGGHISIVANPVITILANAGANGITSSSSLTEFTPNGATRGGAGVLVSEPYVGPPVNVCFSLPVHFVSFRAAIENGMMTLVWTTAEESNLRHYVVEESKDAKHWLQRAVEPALGAVTNKYMLKMSAPLSSVYVRIRSVDYDGKSQFSETRFLKVNEQSPVLSLSNTVVEVNSLSVQSKTILLYNSTGQLQKVYRNPGTGVVRIDISNLPAGVYYLRWGSGGSFKFLKR